MAEYMTKAYALAPVDDVAGAAVHHAKTAVLRLSRAASEAQSGAPLPSERFHIAVHAEKTARNGAMRLLVRGTPLARHRFALSLTRWALDKRWTLETSEVTAEEAARVFNDNAVEPTQSHLSGGSLSSGGGARDWDTVEHMSLVTATTFQHALDLEASAERSRARREVELEAEQRITEAERRVAAEAEQRIAEATQLAAEASQRAASESARRAAAEAEVDELRRQLAAARVTAAQ
jgi:hypothetical protein